MNIFRLTVFVLAVGLVSCQKEEGEFVDQNDQQECDDAKYRLLHNYTSPAKLKEFPAYLKQAVTTQRSL